MVMIYRFSLALALLLLPLSGQAQNVVHVRREVSDLMAHQPEVLDAYAKAVQVMKGREPTDPTSWTYQANMHGRFPTDTIPHGKTEQELLWSQCQHGSYFFLAWHRMYIYYFERIVRAAAGALTNGIDFALPYWDYAGAGRRKLPERFRLPADPSTNALYIAERDGDINNGASLVPQVVSNSAAFLLTRFNATPSFPPTRCFGGETAGPVHFRRPHGALESQPHDVVHGALGGETGWMGDPDMAGRDPIFWLHHANIDRLWEAWLHQGNNRQNPPDGAWLDTKFTFFDENRQKVTKTARDILNTQTQLSYRYEEPAQPSVVGAPEMAAPEPVGKPVVAAESVGGPFAVKDDGNRLEMAVVNESRLATPPAAAPGTPQPEFVVYIAGLEMRKRSSSGLFGVYLNLPPDATPASSEKYLAGVFSTFGFEAKHQHSAPSAPDGSADQGGHLIPVTEAVKRLQAAGAWDGKHVTITVRPISGVENSNKKLTAGDCSIGKVTLLVR
jgi:tyrosinase